LDFQNPKVRHFTLIFNLKMFTRTQELRIDIFSSTKSMRVRDYDALAGLIHCFSAR
jgi:hypothetical protein